jgi:hypothetical protein
VTINDLEHILEKRYANSIKEALNIDDLYVILSQCYEIEKQSIDNSISKKISEMP